MPYFIQKELFLPQNRNKINFIEFRFKKHESSTQKT